jgi:hypothetical protein
LFIFVTMTFDRAFIFSTIRDVKSGRTHVN